MEKRVLVAEDDEQILGLLRELLSSLGYQPMTARNGLKALHIIKESSVPVAIIDIRMPKMGGLSVLKEIRKNHYRTEVILITGFPSAVPEQTGKTWGAFGYLAKPFKLEQIESLLEECFRMLETTNDVTRLERENVTLRDLLKRLDTPTREGEPTQSEEFVDFPSFRSVMHEIQNHLAVMRGSAQILKRRLRVGTDKARAVDSLIRSIDALSGMTSKFRQFKEEHRFGFSFIDPRRLLRETIEWLKPKVPKNIKLTVRLSEKIPQIYADASGLRQVFTNIIFNAVEAMPRGGQLKVKGKVTKRQDKSGIQDLCLDFSDSGVGIPKKDFPNIFIPGYSTKEKGRGLGLAVTKKIIEDHAGEINFTSEVNKGTTFTVQLPIREGDLNGVKRKSSNR